MTPTISPYLQGNIEEATDLHDSWSVPLYQRSNGFRRVILGCKASASSSNDKIYRIYSITPLHKISLDGEHIVWDDLLFFDDPLVAAITGKSISENISCLVGGRITVRCV